MKPVLPTDNLIVMKLITDNIKIFTSDSHKFDKTFRAIQRSVANDIFLHNISSNISPKFLNILVIILIGCTSANRE